MRAIILAAGVGNRLESVSAGRPKCLLELDGVALLERHFRSLAALGISDIRMCLGFGADQVEAELARSPWSRRVATSFNADFTEGSIVSLWTMRAALDGGDSVLVMDADVLYAHSVLARLVESAQATALLLDRDFQSGDEPVKVCLRAGRIVEFDKRIPPGLAFDTIGESVGFFKLGPAQARALARCCEEYVVNGRRSAPHEHALRELMLARPTEFAAEDITGLPWIEIDFPEDVERARAEILPRIVRSTQ